MVGCEDGFFFSTFVEFKENTLELRNCYSFEELVQELEYIKDWAKEIEEQKND